MTHNLAVEMKKKSYIVSLACCMILISCTLWASQAGATGRCRFQEAKLVPDDLSAGAEFGRSVAIQGDLVAVGAGAANVGSIRNAGAAYVYSIHWDSVDLVTKLTASDAFKGDQFGQSIAVAGDTIAVGANRADIDPNENQGAIYIYRHSGNEWTEMNKMTASDGAAGGEFGYSLAVFGNRLVTGGHFVNGDEGAAYVIPVRDTK